MAAQRQVHVNLVRGGVDIDVLATDIRDGIRTTIVCECKYWETPIPQAVVHAFRTVIADMGANHGYIISKVGFQAGAYEAVKSTNVELLTFNEFQARFFKRWVKARLDALEKSIGDFNVYYEPLGIPGIGLLADPAEQEAYYAVWKKHRALGWVIWQFSPYVHILADEIQLPALPLASPGHGGEVYPLPADVSVALGYRELIARMEAHAIAGLAELRAHNPETRGLQAHEIVSDD